MLACRLDLCVHLQPNRGLRIALIVVELHVTPEFTICTQAVTRSLSPHVASTFWSPFADLTPYVHLCRLHLYRIARQNRVNESQPFLSEVIHNVEAASEEGGMEAGIN
jgi:hypothetical protein